MRRILVDHARMKKSQRRGAGAPSVVFDETLHGFTRDAHVDVLELDEALNSLAEMHPEKAQVLEYRIFGDLSNEEIAGQLTVSTATVENYFRFARAFIKRRLTGYDERTT